MLPLELGYAMEDDPHFPLGMDAVALAHDAAASCKPAARVCELGCGAGGVLLLLASNRTDLALTGLELRPDAANLARENVRYNGAEGRVSVVEGDLRAIRALFSPASFDAVLANPPYRAVSEGNLPAHPDDAAARTEVAATLNDFCHAAAYLLPHNGECTLVYPAARLVRLFRALTDAGLEPKTLTLLYPDTAHAPSVALCRAKKGARPGLSLAAPVFSSHPE
ncbi:MAG: methyltransferase [Clostridiaceae bacterium]|nr:methyltransferase [Clostridiaceae bacterium]